MYYRYAISRLEFCVVIQKINSKVRVGTYILLGSYYTYWSYKCFDTYFDGFFIEIVQYL